MVKLEICSDHFSTWLSGARPANTLLPREHACIAAQHIHPQNCVYEYIKISKLWEKSLNPVNFNNWATAIISEAFIVESNNLLGGSVNFFYQKIRPMFKVHPAPKLMFSKYKKVCKNLAKLCQCMHCQGNPFFTLACNLRYRFGVLRQKMPQVYPWTSLADRLSRPFDHDKSLTA